MTRPAVRLPEELRQQIVQHCLAELPNEGCGLFAVDGADIVRVYETSNLDESPVSFTVPPEAHIEALMDADSNDWTLGGSFHSHPNGPAIPSSIDASRALDPEWVYLVVGLAGEPEVRMWSIAGGLVTEVPTTP